ncbi:type II secretion system F family protein [Marinomonas sp. A79]|uniref:Type II secretion system F family protein n=1 Tax=Marinomonas vulgaris TaxID=2823372 RepID=A0ABS5HAA1_9GAMM|nr:type II secretion system F family protein [Marinomonas vulgaris]MBR7888597.1 type II secretion system F family protein [Marinomonas vulgaris]
MFWYKIKYHNGRIGYQLASSESSLVYGLVQQGTWRFSITPWKPQTLDYKSLHTFFTELQSALQSGLQLNQALSHLALSPAKSNLSIICKAVLSQLEQGISFNVALSTLVQTSASPYCQLLNTQGTREDCNKSLSLSIDQLNALLEWSKRLLKTLIYPFSIIQIALLILIANKAMQAKSADNLVVYLLDDGILYLLCSALQLLVIRSLYLGNACYWLERYSQAFRLTKLFSLLHTTHQSGVPLQQAIKSMPEYFQHHHIKKEIFSVYYTLRLGKKYAGSFPDHWFPKESAIALHSAEQDGDIERALTIATLEHEKRWQSTISLLEKFIPALCLLVAGGIVASALVALYAPLMNMP